MRRKPSADIDHPQIDIGLGEQRKHARRGADGAVPLPEIGLLRADMKRHAIWVETEFSRSAQQPDCHLGGAAELARQRPLGPSAVDQDAAEDLRSRGGPRQFVEFVRAVEGKEPHPRAIGEGYVLFLLDRVAIGEPIGGDAVVDAELDFPAARDVEIGALALEHGDDCGGGVGLDRIIDAGERQMPAQRIVSLGDRLEIDDEAWGLGRIFGEEARNPLIHSWGSSFPRGG